MPYLNTEDWLDAYLKKSLTDQDRKDLEKRLLADKDFKEEFATYLAVRQAVQEEEKENLRGWYYMAKNVRRMRLRWMALAASILLLVGVTWLFLRPVSFSNVQEIYALYEQQQTIRLTVRGDNTEILGQAEAQFRAKDYPAAVQSFDSYLATSPDDAFILLNKAIAQRNIAGQEQVALATFDGLMEETPILRQEAEWQKVLTLLRLERLGECRDALNAILLEEGHEYGGEAAVLLGQLDKIK